MEFDHDAEMPWTVIVGDNSTGKSVLLRSLALGLCDQTSAAGLLRESDEGYIRRQRDQVDRLRRYEEQAIPAGFDFGRIRHLSNEARAKLDRFRPATIGQASRIAGVRPSDVQLLLVHLGR